MKNLFLFLQIGLSVLLIILILIQAKGVGLGRAWGGGGEFYKSRRGVEKVIFNLTVILAILFLASSVLNLVLL
ncbi:preprotein translocase subunit SecG [Candidatus Gottesmanbacteria bacterium RIFCSPHIGHO2_02_FULL_39_14]|uniref:Protein-export membrane protein SecG n=2 Tax=Candidatus Gottesmaniibacteriota TaxID=1752720 RepID=A0A1F6A0Z8_9BACT|nr:MAG: preprotein translocase subunit SecG [Candidatus Gottesmanbacteria bacterium RBG_16_38_7b]OGG18366.1 MAG: preprotein translocase subunit SecG [Candidatus Gottesmanbacteria bacterium RIFCSPHIGHO2_02_FULL_39_14]